MCLRRFLLFVQRGGTITCKITCTNRRYSVDLPQGGLEIPCILKFEGEKKDVAKLDKLIQYAVDKNVKKIPDTVNEAMDCGEPPSKKINLGSDAIVKCIENTPETETISCGRKLSDLHIDYAQQLIKKQFPSLNGLQSTLYQSKKQVGGTMKNRLQVIHSRGDHWIVATTVGSSIDDVVLVYDSLYTSIDKATTETICNVFSESTTVELMPSQKQKGGADCAIAMATGIAFGVDPTALRFSQTRMRDHLAKCFNNKVLSLFPVIVSCQ